MNVVNIRKNKSTNVRLNWNSGKLKQIITLYDLWNEIMHDRITI